MPTEIDLFHEFMAADQEYSKYGLGQPATEGEITDFEARYNIHLPEDVREFFLKVNGINPHGGFISLKPLNEWDLMANNKYYQPEYIGQYVSDIDRYFEFGNYDILVWHWIIKLDADPNAETPVFVLYEKFTKIADNFSDFLRKFRTESMNDLLGYS
jgi:hypothetical protein